MTDWCIITPSSAGWCQRRPVYYTGCCLILPLCARRTYSLVSLSRRRKKNKTRARVCACVLRYTSKYMCIYKMWLVLGLVCFCFASDLLCFCLIALLLVLLCFALHCVALLRLHFFLHRIFFVHFWCFRSNTSLRIHFSFGTARHSSCLSPQGQVWYLYFASKLFGRVCRVSRVHVPCVVRDVFF